MPAPRLRASTGQAGSSAPPEYFPRLTFSRRIRYGVESDEFCPLDALIDQLLDVAYFLLFVRSSEGDGLADMAGPACPAYPVDIIVGIIRQIIVDYQLDAADIQSARRDISRD